MPRSILIIDNQPEARERLAARLRSAQYRVEVTADLGALGRGVTGAPALVLYCATASWEADLATLGGVAAAMPGPVLCLAGRATPARRLQALQAGARDLMPLALPESLLLARLRNLVRDADNQREIERRRAASLSLGFAEAPVAFGQRRRVVCVGRPAEASALMERLQPLMAVDLVDASTALKEPEEQEHPDAYVIFGTGPKYFNQLNLLPELRARAHSRHAAFLAVCSPSSALSATLALDNGASDVAFLDADAEELAIRVQRILKQKARKDALRWSMEQSWQAAATDPLTGLYNRRYAETYLTDVQAQARSSGRDYTVMLLDLDHFKAINDAFGHAAGDAVLAATAQRIRENLRAIDLVARYGGEEFLVVLPETDMETAGPAADRLRALIGRVPVRLEDGREVTVTASIGVAVGRGGRPGESAAPGAGPGRIIAGLVAEADAALYRAKAAGRNRIDVSSPAVSAA